MVDELTHHGQAINLHRPP